MENEQDKNKKDKPIPEEELFDELDAMYQRVADIEKEEAKEILTHEDDASSSTPGARVASEKSSKKKSGRNEKRSLRPVILGAIAILFALILGITFWKPAAILDLLKISDTQQIPVSPRPAPRKPPAVVTPKPSPAPAVPPAVATSPAPPTSATSPVPSKPPAAITPPAPPIPPVVATSPAPSKPASEPAPVQKPEAVKNPTSLPHGRHYAIQIGSFREMENVRDLIGVLKKEGLDAYWIASASKKRGSLYKVFVGQFMDKNEAAQFQKDKSILKNYPDSFIQEVSSSRIVP